MWHWRVSIRACHAGGIQICERDQQPGSVMLTSREVVDRAGKKSLFLRSLSKAFIRLSSLLISFTRGHIQLVNLATIDFSTLSQVSVFDFYVYSLYSKLVRYPFIRLYSKLSHNLFLFQSWRFSLSSETRSVLGLLTRFLELYVSIDYLSWLWIWHLLCHNPGHGELGSPQRVHCWC